MTKKWCFYFLVLVCLFFGCLSSSSADELKQFKLDYSTTNLSHVGDYVIYDSNTDTSYTFSDVFDEIIQKFANDNKIVIVITGIDSRRLEFDIYHFFDNTTVKDYNLYFGYNSRDDFYSIKFKSDKVHMAQFHFLDNDSSYSSFDEFSMDSLLTSISDFLDNDTRIDSVVYFPIFSFDTVYNDPLFYYSNVDVSLYDSDKEIKFTDVNGHLSYVLPQSGANSLFYLRGASRYDRVSNPRPIFNVLHPVFENNLCVSADIVVDFSFFDSHHDNMYSFNNDFITIDKSTTVNVASNGSIVAKSLNLNNALYYNEKSFTYDFIGKDKAYFDSFAENLYNSNFDEDISSITLSSATSIPDYLRYWYLSIKKTFPAIFQIRDLISLFDSSRHVDTCNNDINSCLSVFFLDLSFFGISQPVSIFNFSIFSAYRTQIFVIITFFVALTTFRRSLVLLQTMFKKE